jgi:hypothetical protein
MFSQQFLLGILLGAFLGICPAPGQAYDCARKRCTEMSSCAEAHYKFTVCGETHLDRDEDGIPCEIICGDNPEIYRERLKAEGVEPAAAPKEAQRGLLSESKQPPPPAAPFTCAGKHKCAEMVSCEEARFYLTTCGVSSLDGNHDGAPCEALCQNR